MCIILQRMSVARIVVIIGRGLLGGIGSNDGFVDQVHFFKGEPLPGRVFVNETLVLRDGKWIERLYQVTALKP